MRRYLKLLLMTPLFLACKHRSGNPDVTTDKANSSSTFLPPSFESMYGKKPQSKEPQESDLCTMEYDPHRCYLTHTNGTKNTKVYWDGGNLCVARQNAANDPANEKYKPAKNGVPLMCERQN